ncbi:MAG: RNA polymerase Rpb4 family protein [Methanocalculaceae archaeon]|jgi:DNA-directed RNA polymerase subunit F|nr:RNA polymerase Rpb4 family protein [Methanocalculaceae archaeon]
MKVKKIISGEMMSLPELREVLISIRDQRANEGSETKTSTRMMSYELRKSIDHADSLGKCDPATSRVLIDELNNLGKIRPEISYRIVNIMPKNRDELRAIYAKERYTLLPEDLDKILDVLRQHV